MSFIEYLKAFLGGKSLSKIKEENLQFSLDFIKDSLKNFSAFGEKITVCQGNQPELGFNYLKFFLNEKPIFDFQVNCSDSSASFMWLCDFSGYKVDLSNIHDNFREEILIMSGWIAKTFLYSSSKINVDTRLEYFISSLQSLAKSIILITKAGEKGFDVKVFQSETGKEIKEVRIKESRKFGVNIVYDNSGYIKIGSERTEEYIYTTDERALDILWSSNNPICVLDWFIDYLEKDTKIKYKCVSGNVRSYVCGCRSIIMEYKLSSSDINVVNISREKDGKKIGNEITVPIIFDCTETNPLILTLEEEMEWLIDNN